jgi:hypothetical protein
VARTAIATADAIYRSCQWQWEAVLTATTGDVPAPARTTVLRSRAYAEPGRPVRAIREARQVVEATGAEDPDHVRA